jgi:integrase
VRLPAAHVAEHIDLGYALTVHRAQGLTADTAHLVLTPGTTREALYVGLTRGRESNDAWITTTPTGTDGHDVPGLHRTAPTAADVLHHALTTSSAEPSATELLAELTRRADLPEARRPQMSPAPGPARHTGPTLFLHRLDRLQPEHVETAYTHMLDSGLAPATVLHAHRVLSRALKIALQRGHVARNVCTLVEPPSVPHQEVQPLTRAEARRILDTAATRRNAARWSVALALGLRQGEALGLSWTDIDLDRGTLRVRYALQRQIARHGCGGTCGRKRGADCPQRIGGGLVLVEPKSRTSRRTIALADQFVDALTAHRAVQDADRVHAGTTWVDTGLVFTRPAGEPSTPRTTTRPGRPCSPTPACATPASTTPATPPPPSCSPWACPPAPSCRSSGTARSPSPSAPTATSNPSSPTRPPSASAAPCGTDGTQNGTHPLSQKSPPRHRRRSKA